LTVEEMSDSTLRVAAIVADMVNVRNRRGAGAIIVLLEKGSVIMVASQTLARGGRTDPTEVSPDGSAKSDRPGATGPRSAPMAP
jgi:hypothetical protein